MNDDDVLSLAAANAQIRRLRADIARYKELLIQAADTFKREQTELRARIVELEAEHAFVFGTLEKPTPHE